MTSLRGHERREFPLSVRKKAFQRCCLQGTMPGVPQCETCGYHLNVRAGTIYEHVIPDGLGGEPTLDNCKVNCKTCADVKTFTEDNPRMAKADRVLKKNFGLRNRKSNRQDSARRRHNAAPPALSFAALIPIVEGNARKRSRLTKENYDDQVQCSESLVGRYSVFG